MLWKFGESSFLALSVKHIYSHFSRDVWDIANMNLVIAIAMTSSQMLVHYPLLKLTNFSIIPFKLWPGLIHIKFMPLPTWCLTLYQSFFFLKKECVCARTHMCAHVYGVVCMLVYECVCQYPQKSEEAIRSPEAGYAQLLRQDNTVQRFLHFVILT